MEINPITVVTTQAMELCVFAIDDALQRLWSQDPARGLDASELRMRVADLEVLLPHLAEQADIFFHSDFREEDYLSELYFGFALWALHAMLDARALWAATTVAQFVSELEHASNTVYELRKYANTVVPPRTKVSFEDPEHDADAEEGGIMGL
jgi:hypothetical protein